MVRSAQLRDLRVGPVAAAGGINAATLRTWIANHDLKLGDREGRETGNPRYDLADCARVLLLSLLVQDRAATAPAAVWITNKATGHIALLAAEEMASIENGKAPDCPRFIMRLSASSMRVETNPEIRLFSDPEEILLREEPRGRIMETTIELRELVRMARDRLVSELGHSLSGLRHDFADAPDPKA